VLTGVVNDGCRIHFVSLTTDNVAKYPAMKGAKTTNLRAKEFSIEVSNLRLAVQTWLTGRVPNNRHVIVYKLDYLHFIHKVCSTCNFLRIFGRFLFSPHFVRAVLCVRHNYKVVSDLILKFYFRDKRTVFCRWTGGFSFGL